MRMFRSRRSEPKPEPDLAALIGAAIPFYKRKLRLVIAAICAAQALQFVLLLTIIVIVI